MIITFKEKDQSVKYLFKVNENSLSFNDFFNL